MASLTWAVLKSNLPKSLKLTCQTLAAIADADKNFENIFMSKATLAGWNGRSEATLRRDMLDLEFFGVVTCWEARQGWPKKYRFNVDRLVTWSEADTERYIQRRRLSQRRQWQKHPLQRLDPNQPCVREGSWATTTPTEVDRTQGSDPSRTQEATSIVHGGESVLPNFQDDCTVDERGPAAENAGAPKAAPVAGSSAGDPRADAVALAMMESPSKMRHRVAAQDRPEQYTLCKHSDEKDPVFTEAFCYRLLEQAGHRHLKKMADEGGGFEWDRAKSALWGAASLAGFIPPVELTNSVLRSLESQHKHFLASRKGAPAAPDTKPLYGPPAESV